MGNLLQSQCSAEVGKVVKQLNDAAIVGLEKLAQGKDRKQLRLREISSGERTGVGNKPRLGYLQSLSGQGHRRFGHGTHLAAPPSMTYSSVYLPTTLKGFQQSI